MVALAACEPDAELMSRVRDGDAASFTLLLERHRRPVIHFLYRMVQSQPVAEELAQEVFLRVYRSRATYEPSAKFTTWLFRIATNQALNWLRHGKREHDRAEPVGAELRDARSNVEEEMIRRVRFAQVRAAIARLPDKQRAAVLMHKYHEMEYGQIAAALGCSESAVKFLLFRAYESLRVRLSELA